MSGFVYFIGYGHSDWVKVGFATNVKNRLKGLKCSSPEPLSVLAAVSGTLADEQRLHAAIFGPRNREWFLRPSVEGLIEMALEGRPIDEIIRRAERTKRIIHGAIAMERAARVVVECEDRADDARRAIRERVSEMVA